MELEDIGMVPYEEGNWLWPFFNCLKYKYKVYELKEANPWHVLFISSDYSQRQSYTFESDSTNDDEKWDLPQKQHPTLTFLLVSCDNFFKYPFPISEAMDKSEALAKPVIYLYPEAETEVNVRLDYKGRLTCTYPAPDPDGAWRVTALPDGTLTDNQGREYSYLFWEGASDETLPDFSRGFVVKGSDTAAFLREKLAYMGLTPREYNEFIVYWLPRMQDNPWNLIAFQGKNYTDSAPLAVTPRPDSVLRVFMAYRPMAAPVVVPPQELTPFVRKGFTLVEWGGQGPDEAVR